MRGLAAFIALTAAVGLSAQTTDASTNASVNPFPPIRVEFGGYGNYFQNGGGWWRGFDSTIWIRETPKFVPAITFDSRTSDLGTERYFSFFSYANWTKNFYTTQSISGTPDGGNMPLLFPRLRYDAKAWFKLPPNRRVIPGLGVTRFTVNNGLGGVIVNPGVLYYRGKFVFDAEGFINRNEPGTLWSGSGLLAVQRGQEGRYWVGATIGAGRQTYQELANQPLEVRYASTSVDGFYRRWLTRKFGFVISGGYQDAFHYFQRASVSAHVFFEF